MKKNINIILGLLIILLLSSCITSQDEVNKAKENLGIIETNNVDNNLGNTGNIQTEIKDETIIDDENIQENIVEEKEEIKKIIIESLTENQLLEFDDLSSEDVFDGKVEIKGKTLGKVDEIVVTFVNNDSNFPVDTYKLKQFSPGDETFLYRAFTKYETLDNGKNVYIFEAFSGDTSTKLQMTINVIEEEKTKIDPRVEDISSEKYENIDLDKLPLNTDFGNPIDLGNGKVGYSDLKGLEIKKDMIPNLTCDNLTNILTDRIDSWFFWNMCRPIEEDEGISFFVIRLEGDKYIYEKHYYLSYEGLYGTIELEKGTGVDSTNIREKNTELKGKNDNYSILEVSDKLFKEILK